MENRIVFDCESSAKEAMNISVRVQEVLSKDFCVTVQRCSKTESVCKGGISLATYHKLRMKYSKVKV